MNFVYDIGVHMHVRVCVRVCMHVLCVYLCIMNSWYYYTYQYHSFKYFYACVALLCCVCVG